MSKVIIKFNSANWIWMECTMYYMPWKWSWNHLSVNLDIVTNPIFCVKKTTFCHLNQTSTLVYYLNSNNTSLNHLNQMSMLVYYLNSTNTSLNHLNQMSMSVYCLKFNNISLIHFGSVWHQLDSNCCLILNSESHLLLEFNTRHAKQ